MAMMLLLASLLLQMSLGKSDGKSWWDNWEHREIYSGFQPHTCETLAGFSSTVHCEGLGKVWMARIQQKMYSLYRQRQWAELEELTNKYKCNGGFPPCNGGYDWFEEELRAGQKYDRYVYDVSQSYTHDNRTVPLIGGQFTSPQIDNAYQDVGSRSLPAPVSEYLFYVRIEVLQNLTAMGSDVRALSSRVIPWFGEPGKGLQTYFMLPRIGRHPVSWNTLTGLLDDEVESSPYFRVLVESSPSGRGYCLGCELQTIPVTASTA